MYNLNNLWIFAKVAEIGSFNKVAEQEYLSPNTVMRQITALEEELGGIKLFERNNKGSKLTKAGEMLYNDAKTILAECEESKQRIINEISSENSVRLAITYDTEFREFSDLFSRVHAELPEIKLNLQPMIYHHKMNKALWHDFSHFTDLIFDYFTILPYSEYNGIMFERFPLRKAPLLCAMSTNHRLAKADTISFEDLNGETIFIKRHTWSNAHASVIAHIQSNYPEINLTPVAYYSTETYNSCANGEFIVLDFSDLSFAHPFIKSVSVDAPFEAFFGISFITPPSPSVKKFTDTMKALLAE